MSEEAAEREENNGNSAVDWEIFDILCRDNFEINVSKLFLMSNYLKKKMTYNWKFSFQWQNSSKVAQYTKRVTDRQYFYWMKFMKFIINDRNRFVKKKINFLSLDIRSISRKLNQIWFHEWRDSYNESHRSQPVSMNKWKPKQNKRI